MTRKLSIVNDHSNVNYSVGGNEIINSTEVLKSNLCDYNDYCILVRGDITIAGHNLGTQVAFKNCAQITNCIKQNDGTMIDDTEDLNLVVPVYNLLGYSWNYYDTAGSL